jgi:predicted RNase H-like HicB family nuclease
LRIETNLFGKGLVKAIKQQLGLNQESWMRYPINLKKDDRHFLVTFPDIPEVITQGKTIEEAKASASLCALETALDFYIENSRTVPTPSRVKCGQEFVELPATCQPRYFC